MAPVVLLALLVLCLGTMLLQASEVEVCDVNEKGAVGDGVSDNTVLLQSLIDDEGCTELYFPSGNTYVSGSLFLRSNLVVTIDGTLFASPDYKNHEKWPLIYTRYAGFMRMMTASLLNGGQCKKMKENWNNLPPYIHGDQCAEWDKLENVTIKGSGNINGNGANSGFTNNLIYSAFRPTLLGLTWITGLTLTGTTYDQHVSLRPTALDFASIASYLSYLSYLSQAVLCGALESQQLSSSITYCNITSIAHNHNTNNYPNLTLT